MMEREIKSIKYAMVFQQYGYEKVSVVTFDNPQDRYKYLQYLLSDPQYEIVDSVFSIHNPTIPGGTEAKQD